MYYTHLIYYDENIDYGSENYGYVCTLKNKIKGAFFPINKLDTLKNLVNKLKSINKYSKFNYFSYFRKSM